MQTWSSEKHFSTHDVRTPDVYFQKIGRRRLCPCPKEWMNSPLLAVCSRIGDSLRELVLTPNIFPKKELFDLVVERCPNIETLRLDGCYLTSRDLRFNEMKSLKRLDFWSCYADCMQQLSIPPCVQVVSTLRIGHDDKERAIPTEQLADFLREHPNLIELDVERVEEAYESSMPFDVFAVVAANAPQLRRLSVQGHKLVFDGIAQLASIEELKIVKVPLTDEHLVSFCSANPGLQSFLYYSHLWSLTRASFDALGALRNLQSLDLRCAFAGGRDDDALLRPVIEGCGATLRCLVFSKLNLGDSTIDRIAAFCPRVRRLRLRYCSRVSAKAIRRLISAVVASPTWRSSGDKLDIEVVAYVKENAQRESLQALRLDMNLVPRIFSVQFSVEIFAV